MKSKKAQKFNREELLQKLYLSFDELAFLTGLTVSTIKKDVYQLGAPSHKRGGRKMIYSEYMTWSKQFRETRTA